MNRDELFDKYLRGELSPSETAALKQLLASDAEAGRAFVEHTNETNLIIRIGSQLQSASLAQNVVPLVAPSVSSGRNYRPGWKAAALAACLIGLGVIGIMLSRLASARLSPGAHISGNNVQVMRDGVLMGGNVFELQAGDQITASSNEMAVISYEGESTRIQMFPGTVVWCGNASAGKRFELRRGGIQARVAPQPAGKPMLVTTAHAQATVVGTEFVVRADERATKLDVFQGRVELACRSNAKKVIVNAGFWASSTGNGTSEAKPLCKCSKCRGTNEPANCPNLKKKNEN